MTKQPQQPSSSQQHHIYILYLNIKWLNIERLQNVGKCALALLVFKHERDYKKLSTKPILTCSLRTAYLILYTERNLQRRGVRSRTLASMLDKLRLRIKVLSRTKPCLYLSRSVITSTNEGPKVKEGYLDPKFRTKV